MNDAINKPAVLVIDDDKEVLISFEIWLKGEGFIPLCATNSSAACKILEEMKVDVTLIDFRLGTENGLQIAEMLKSIDETMKIIIITGYPSYDIAVKSIKAGMFDYLSKGESNEKIMETIKKAIHAKNRESLENGKNFSRENYLKYIVICKHSLIIERLRSFSLNSPDFKLMRTYNSIEHLLDADYTPEVDIAMICASCCIKSMGDAFLFFDELYKILPFIKPIIFNEQFTEMEKVELIKSGVKGFFSIELNSETFEKALSLIKKGEIWASRKLIHMAVPNGPEYLKNLRAHLDSYGLSSREKDILRAMVMGLKNKEIADKLFISEMTVKSHINRIYKKFKVDNRAKAICFSIEKKIL